MMENWGSGGAGAFFIADERQKSVQLARASTTLRRRLIDNNVTYSNECASLILIMFAYTYPFFFFFFFFFCPPGVGFFFKFIKLFF